MPSHKQHEKVPSSTNLPFGESIHMAIFSDAPSLADFLLRNAVKRLTSVAPRVNYSSLRSVGGASRLLGLDAYAESCESILQTLPDPSFTRSLVANFSVPKKPAQAQRKIAPMERLNSDHPRMTEGSVVQYLRDCGKSESHLRLAIERRYKHAFDACKSELDIEETACAQAVLGDIDVAIDSASNVVKPDFRSNNVRFICAIELFRRERWSDAHELFDLIYPSRIGPDAAAQMALGANHRLPWVGYPLPDW